MSRYRIAEIGDRQQDAAASRAADRIEAAVAKALTDPRARTRDIGGTAPTREASDAMLQAL